MVSLESGLLIGPKNGNFSNLPKHQWHREKSWLFSSTKFCQRKDRNYMIFILLTSPLMVIIFVLSGSSGLSFLHQGYNQYGHLEVWHHCQTIGILGFRGPERTLTSCQLILVEGKDESRKPEILSELSKTYETIEEVDFDLMLSIVQSCQDLQTQRIAPTPPYQQQQQQPATGGVTINMWTMLKGIVPGTKWCGVNDIANSYHDLGFDFEVDKCCRAHDHCPVKVKSFSTNYGAKNNHPYTKSHCACDDLFYRCLKQIEGEEAASKAATIGKVYFNILRLECGEPKYPRVCLQTKPREIQNKNVDENIASRKETADSPLKRMFLGVGFSLEPVEEKESKEVCTEWVEDRDSIPSMTFRVPKRLF